MMCGVYVRAEEGLVESEAETTNDSVVRYAQGVVVVFHRKGATSRRPLTAGVVGIVAGGGQDVQLAVLMTNLHFLDWCFEHGVQRL